MAKKKTAKKSANRSVKASKAKKMKKAVVFGIAALGLIALLMGLFNKMFNWKSGLMVAIALWVIAALVAKFWKK